MSSPAFPGRGAFGGGGVGKVEPTHCPILNACGHAKLVCASHVLFVGIWLN